MVYIFLLIGLLTRFMPHVPNFTPITAIALFGGAYLARKHAVYIPLLIMMLSDFFLGMHETVLFTWGSVALIALIGLRLRENISAKNTVLSAVISSLLFFVITNLGVWISTSLYAHNIQGLIDCFVMAIPFYRNQLFGDMLYVTVLFGGYNIITALLKKTASQTV